MSTWHADELRVALARMVRATTAVEHAWLTSSPRRMSVAVAALKGCAEDAVRVMGDSPDAILGPE